MRYKKLLFVLMIILFPVVVLAKDVSIKSVELVENSDYVEELSKPSYEGLNVNFDLKFHLLGDRAVYKVVLSNNDNENYFLNLKTNSNSKYISYTIDSNENTNAVKSGKDTTIFIIVDYKNEVPSNMFVNNVYKENNNVKLLLTNNKGEEIVIDGNSKNSKIVVNPETGNIVLKIKNTNITISLYTILIVLLLTIVLIVLLKRLRIKKYINMLLVLGLLIPGLVMAINEITIVINGKIEIEPTKFIKFKMKTMNNNGFYGNKKTYYGEEGMTVKEWVDSKYNIDNYNIVEEIEDNNNNNSCVVEDYLYGSSSNGSMKMDDLMEDGKIYTLYREECPFSFGLYDPDSRITTYYHARTGMTWGEWIESNYNHRRIKIVEKKENTCQDGYIVYDDETPIKTSDIIEQKDYSYYEDCKIHFYLSYNHVFEEYDAKFGMTWSEWLESEYNTKNISFTDRYVGECVPGKYMRIWGESTYLLTSDIIIEGKYYEHESISCGNGSL